MMEDRELLSIAGEYGTPLFAFDTAEFESRFEEIRAIFGPRIKLCYAMKANPFLVSSAARVADRIEVCSPGELDICMHAHIPPEKIVYSGVNKLPEDIERAITYGVDVVTAESLLHARYIEQVARDCGRVVDVLPRLNAGSQFGMSREDFLWLVDEQDRFPHINLVGLHYFVGTQRAKLKHQAKELGMIEALLDELRDTRALSLKRLEYGPGLAVPYFEGDDFSDTLAPARELAPMLTALSDKVEVTVEMGRFFAFSCGAYLTRAMDIKTNKGVNYCILDGGMNHLVYAGQMMGLHVPLIANLTHFERDFDAQDVRDWCLCGSLCSVNDILARSATLTDLAMGDVLAFKNAGAYSVTEGIALFLSRTMPRIVMRAASGEWVLVRDFMESSRFNELTIESTGRLAHNPLNKEYVDEK